ncbi:MinD/ParA family protein [Clostridium sp. HV4-5-A1G]|uniref:MinD/ParA family protein n=1 Tax=Clostridium sp. HV4-5-A1G TaxID=2004595 RepID=UPI00123B57CD|nr:MinD/ParA family protein [Clostridium sp. HV4-5-A1G]KAA8675200.1 MinD/ParA family protein [Clostridium sp. HV4-5-A1G]
MLDQAEKLRRLASKGKEVKKDFSQCAAKPTIITVTSGKGGVGKSNFVVNTAIALQKMKKKVLILDADMGMGNDHVLMGFLPRYSVYDVIFGNKKIDEIIVTGPFGVKLLPGGTGISKIEEITKSQRENFIEKLSLLGDLDYIILDTGAGINRDVLGFIACCEEVIVITTPEPTSLTDAYSLVKAVDHFKLKSSVKIVINKVMNIEEGKKTFNKFNSVVNKFLNIYTEYLGSMSEDKRLIQAVRQQTPFLISYPNSKISREVNFIANRLSGVKTDEGGKGIQDLFKRIFDIFS